MSSTVCFVGFDSRLGRWVTHLKFLEVRARLLPRGPHHKQEVWGQDKWHSLFVDAQETFVIPKNVSKVYVK